MAHRLLICAGLAEGKSLIKGISTSEDILATRDCLEELGASITGDGDAWTVQGVDAKKSSPILFRCRESGSTLRFFIPIASLCGREVRFEGSERLMSRPLSVYEGIFKSRGLLFDADGKRVTIQGPLTPGTYEMDGSVSSQFVSGLLFALSLLEGDSAIKLIPPVESRPYIDMTIASLKEFGVEASWQGENVIAIPGNQKYTACDATVEGDWSNAAFLIAMGAKVEGLNEDSLQGDKICVEYFKELDKGCAELDISDCPDLGPVLMAYAALRHGCVLHGAERLKIKESDRGEAMKAELAKFGVQVDIDGGDITVGSGIHAPTEQISSHNDHRIAMAMTIPCLKTGGVITGAEAVAKSYPDFFEVLSKISKNLS